MELDFNRISGNYELYPLHGTDLRFVIFYLPPKGNIGNVNIEDYGAVMEAVEDP